MFQRQKPERKKIWIIKFYIPRMPRRHSHADWNPLSTIRRKLFLFLHCYSEVVLFATHHVSLEKSINVTGG